jgi:hypothetical protein
LRLRARAGEYLSEALDKHLATVDTARRLTVHWHDTPWLNGIVERLNRTLVEKKWAGAAVYGRSSDGDTSAPVMHLTSLSPPLSSLSSSSEVTLTRHTRQRKGETTEHQRKGNATLM